MPLPSNDCRSVKDLELNKFTLDSDGEVAVNNVIANAPLKPGTDFDRIDVTYPTTTSEVFTYTLSAASVLTITLTYTDSTKCDISSVVYS